MNPLLAPPPAGDWIVEPVLATAQRDEFIELPYRVHRGLQYWVPPLRRDVRRLLDPKIHPFHQHASVAYFMARKSADAPAAGRIAAIINHRHNEHHHDRVGFFGFLDAEDDRLLFHALLHRAAQWVHEQGYDTLRGPCSFSTNEECALLVEGFDRPACVMIPYHPPYYARHIEVLGGQKAVDLLSYWANRENLTDRLYTLRERAMKRLAAQGTLTIREVRLKHLPDELKIVQAIYNEAWGDNWGFVPITDAEIAFMASEMKPIVDPRLALIAEFNGVPAAFSLALPDFSQLLMHMNGRLNPLTMLKAWQLRSSVKLVRILALGVAKEFRNRGFDVILYGETARRGIEAGYWQGEFSWILEDNQKMNQALLAIGASVRRRHRIYDWPLATP